MQNDKFNKIFVILLSNTLSYPYTMMIESAHTDITNSTMLTSWWFDYVARFTGIVFQIHNIIIILLEFFYVLLIIA